MALIERFRNLFEFFWLRIKEQTKKKENVNNHQVSTIYIIIKMKNEKIFKMFMFQWAFSSKSLLSDDESTIISTWFEKFCFNGEDLIFFRWFDRWLGDLIDKGRFPLLFNVDEDEDDCLIGEFSLSDKIIKFSVEFSSTFSCRWSFFSFSERKLYWFVSVSIWTVEQFFGRFSKIDLIKESRIKLSKGDNLLQSGQCHSIRRWFICRNARRSKQAKCEQANDFAGILMIVWLIGQINETDCRVVSRPKSFSLIGGFTFSFVSLEIGRLIMFDMRSSSERYFTNWTATV